jgi:PAS domain S-box-containing protein
MAKILLVDDEPNIRWTMAELLKREGYETLTANDYDGALAIIDSTRLDAIVADIILPRRSGIDILKEVSRREPSVPVIMITGEPNVSQIREIVQAGAYDYIAKPVTKDVLVRAIAKAVEKKRLVDERRGLQEQVRRHAEELEMVVARRTSELAEAHKFLGAVLDSATEYAIIAVGQDGRIVLFNRGAELMFDRREDEVKGQPAAQLASDSLASGESSFLKIAREVAGQGGYKDEMALSRFDGSSFVASVIITAICEAEGKELGYLIIAKDLTAERRREDHLRQMRERLAHNEKIAALGRMAAQVAHEVKNPLAGLRLYSLHLKSKLTEKIAAADMALIDKIIDGINQLSDTSEQVLNFARTITLARRRVDLNRVVCDSLALLEPQLQGNRISVALELAEAGALAMLDEASMRSTLINLLLNSVQAMPEGGQLTVATQAGEAALRLAITDTGCGMTDEQVGNIFEPFYTTKSQGLGLGMSFASRVVRLHGGEISVESRVNQGTRITIVLPVKEEKVNAACC